MKSLFLILTLTLASCGGKNNKGDINGVKPNDIVLTDNNGQVTVTPPSVTEQITSGIVVIPDQRPVAVVVITPDEITQTIVGPEMPIEDDEVTIPQEVVVEVTAPENIPVVTDAPIVIVDEVNIIDDAITPNSPVINNPVIEVIDIVDLVDSVEKAKSDKPKLRALIKRIGDRIELLDARLKVLEKNKKKNHFLIIRWEKEREICKLLVKRLNIYLNK